MSITIEEALEEVLRDAKGLILDIGCGRGGSIKHLLEQEIDSSFIIGLDIDIERLSEASNEFRELERVDLVYSSSSHLPFRGESLDTVSCILLFHELFRDLVKPTLEEASRVLRRSGLFIVADKIWVKADSPREDLPLLTEKVYHKAVYYARGHRKWGVQKPESLIEAVTSTGFRLSRSLFASSKILEPEEFFKFWGKDTYKMLEEINSEMHRDEILRGIDKIKDIASKYGYGPTRFLIAIFRK
jgi:ubiquinone/menaquinone biosynthesis C-methylase UbiE